MTDAPWILAIVAVFSYLFIHFFSKVINPQASAKNIIWASISFAIIVVLIFCMNILLLT
ncbi:hypothetical protein DFQ00_107138 [Paenibacillus barcinonensis]|uniref:Uncharacterized protein n=1 Tax=Paenibacillus barcinonensis TaxID=198119 RepID=A0A2V4V8E3_PAEBA|nr:hypothetical protein DFQ00_107138 [Paenibacillus barcinonensis]